MALQRICVFCGSSNGTQPVYVEAAQQMGAALAHGGFTLVYGGGRVGLMGALADAVLEHSGRVVGVMPQHLVDKEIAHTGLSELRVVHSMHERKALMADLADAFIAMPGGYGTFEEFCEMLTWGQLGLHQKACGLLNIAEFYTPLLGMFDHAISEGFVHPAYRGLIVDDVEPYALLERIAAYQPPNVVKWVSRTEV